MGFGLAPNIRRRSLAVRQRRRYRGCAMGRFYGPRPDIFNDPRAIIGLDFLLRSLSIICERAKTSPPRVLLRRGRRSPIVSSWRSALRETETL